MSFSKSVLRDRLSVLLKDHSCVTAPLKTTEDFRIALDDKDDCRCRSGPSKRCLPLCLMAYFF